MKESPFNSVWTSFLQTSLTVEFSSQKKKKILNCNVYSRLRCWRGTHFGEHSHILGEREEELSCLFP